MCYIIYSFSFLHSIICMLRCTTTVLAMQNCHQPIHILVQSLFGWFVLIQTSNFIGVHMNRNLTHVHADSLACIPQPTDTALHQNLLMACGLLIHASVFTANYNMGQE